MISHIKLRYMMFSGVLIFWLIVAHLVIQFVI